LEIDGILSVTSGANVGIAPYDEGFTHAMVMTARDADAVRAFVKHPIHIESGKLAAPLVERRLIMDIESD
jgi:hypothetical protein